MPQIKKSTNIDYLGTKTKLLSFIHQKVEQVTEGKYHSFADVFAWTGTVGSYFKSKGYSVIANDIQTYGFIINRNLIQNSTILPFDKMAEKGIVTDSSISTVFSYLNNLKGVKGFIAENYAPNEAGQGRMYFTTDNAVKIDAIRQEIEKLKVEELITEAQYYFLLHSLLVSVSKVANTTGVYCSYLKSFKKSALSQLIIVPVFPEVSSAVNKTYNMNALSLVNEIEADVVYLDPPYNHRRYDSNYHILETIAKYDNPSIEGISGQREKVEGAEDFCHKTKAYNNFKEMILNIKAKVIFVSYNNEGVLTAEEVKEIMSLRGKYTSFKQEHKRYMADKDTNRTYTATKTEEYLHCVVIEDEKCNMTKTMIYPCKMKVATIPSQETNTGYIEINRYNTTPILLYSQWDKSCLFISFIPPPQVKPFYIK